jgi:hypothetical protein
MANEQPSQNGHRTASITEPLKRRVPHEDATIEEIEAAAAQTGRAAESFLSSEKPTNGHSKSNARS